MEQIKLDIVPAGITPTAHASQFDSGRSQRFNLYNQGAEYTLSGAETITMVVNGVEEPVANTSDNYVVWNIADGDCDEAGVIGCELRIVENDMLIGSKNFFLEVEMDPYDGKNIRIITVGPADICTFETTLPEPLQSVLADVVASGGNGTPDSPIPINGYTEANITRCGVNFFDKSTVTNGRIINGGGNDVSFTGWNVSDYIPVKEGAEFYLYGLITHPNTNQDNFIFFNASKTKIGFANVKTWEYPLTIPSGAKFVKCTCSDTDLNTAQFSLTNNAPYEAYNGTTYAVSWQDEAGTVYGGVLDVTNGTLTVTHDNIASYNGESINEPWLSSMDVYAPNTSPTIGAQVVYPLITPQTYQLTPTQVRALVGVNNVFNDTNGNTEVKFKDSIQHYIDTRP